jgi:hypothetical protein
MLSPYRIPAARKPDPAASSDGTGRIGAAIVVLFVGVLLALAHQHGLTL